ncbi:MAG: restriction endonuclease, partial [Parasporobacterium sp.]|nr:restriction endonuclease [Parasporobacterium sp.]
MANEEVRLWGIHTQDDNLFLKNDVIAIGWHDMGDLRLIEANRDAFKDKYATVYPDKKKGGIATGAGMLYRFCHEVQIGDYVVFPSKSNREVNIGVVDGDYVYDPSQVEYVQTRKVKWLKHLPRMSFSQGALYEIGSAMSFFAVKNYADEFLAA